MLQEVLSSTVDEAKAFIKDPRNKQATLVAGAAYLLSKTDKERNAIIAAVAALILLPEEKKSHGR